MPDEKPNPLNDVVKGLGLLFRAAKTTVERLPTRDFEEAVVTSAREVGRALENVGKTIEREVFGKKAEPGAPSESKTDEPPKADDRRDDEPKPPDAA